MRPRAVGPCDSPQEACSRQAGDEAVERTCDEVGGTPLLHDATVDDHADPVGQRGCVLEVVRDEDRREPELAQQLVQLGAHRGLRVCVERGQRLVEQQRLRPAGKRAGKRDALPLAAGQLPHPGAGERRDPEPLEQLRDRCASRRAETDVLRDVEVREERVLLEEVAHASLLRRAVDPGGRVQPCLVADGDAPAPRSEEAGNHAKGGRLSGAGRPDEGDRLAALDGQLDAGVEGAKGMGVVDPERHRVRSLTESRTPALMTTRTALIASATSKSRSNCS